MSEAGVPMKALKARRRWFYLGNAKTPAGSALLIEQFRILATQGPVLYGVLIINSISIAYVLPPSLPWWSRLGVPGAVLFASMFRMIYWVKLRAVVPTAEQALDHLFKTRILSSTLNAGFTIWALALFENVDLDARAPIALLVFMGSVASAYCLGSFPSAARLTLLISALPISLRLVFTGEAMLVCIGLDLCLLLVPLIRMMNTNYRDLVNVGAGRGNLRAEGRRRRAAEITALKEQAKAREIADRFDSALNNMSQGLCFFDGEQRLIVCNRRYLDMYGLPPESVKPGTLLSEIVQLRFKAGSFPAMTKDEYLGWRNDLVTREEVHDSVVELANGRVFQICHRPMPDRGWVATHEDVTERYHAEKALNEAKSNAERAEIAARAAHGTLIDALDVVPEGLVILDADDRYVLWNRRYAEAYAESLEAITRGVSFEETLRFGLARGQYPDAKGREEQWLRERLARHAQPQSTHEQQLTGDRWVRIEERRTADGGSIGIRVDITDLKRRETSFRLLLEENPLPMWVVDVNTLELLAVNADLSDRKRAEQRIVHLACPDALTDLPNRAALDGHFAKALDDARLRGGSFAVLCIDLDRFKEINDLFGHSMGDKALREASRRLELAAQDAFLARIGGDEFIAITEHRPLPPNAEPLPSPPRGALEPDNPNHSPLVHPHLQT